MTGFRGGQNWSAIYQMANGRHANVTLDVTTNGGFEMIVAAMNRPELADDPRFAEIETRTSNRRELESIVAEWMRQFSTTDEIEAAVGNSAVLAAEVNTVPELAETDWAEERGAFVEVDTGRGATVTVPQSPWRFTTAQTGVGTTAHYRGEHNRQVLQEFLDASDAELEALEADGTISARPPRWAQS